MTKADIVEKVSSLTGLTKVETEATLNGFIASISESLAEGETVDIRSFGSFIIKKRNARDARNPATEEVIKLKDRYIPFFKVSKILKKIVNDAHTKRIIR